MRVGLISDSHGLLRAGVFKLFAGVERILHAGDIGSTDLLVELGTIAPVTAVYGNTDGFEVRARVAETARIEIEGRQVVVTHGDQFGSPRPSLLREAFPEADIIIFGHTHRPLVDRSAGALVVNPGAAGPRRFELLPSIGIMTLGDPSESPEIEIQIIEIDE